MAAAEPQAQAPTTSGAAAAPPAGGDAAAGRLVFRKCQACHSMEPGKTLLGPSLAGIVGRKAGADANYNYSPPMKQANVVWDAKSLDAYLADPQKVVPGNKMPFPGLKTEQDRADVIAFFASAGGGAQAAAAAPGNAPAPAREAPSSPSQAAPQPQPNQAPQPAPDAGVTYLPDARYTLRSGIADGRMVFIGVGGDIDGKVNPVLTAAEGQVVQLTLINGEGAQHDIVFPDQNAKSPRVTGKGASTTIAFRAAKPAISSTFAASPAIGLPVWRVNSSSRPSHRPSHLSRPTSRVNRPICHRRSASVTLKPCASISSAEVEGRLAEGTTFGYWTFNGRVPGPFIRVRVGDTIDIHLKNSADSAMIHSVDFHAATGPGGGAAALQVDPGADKSMTWKALVPGLYVYHCATPMVAEHIANGMYGLILVEPEGGLPPVDREFYVMQGEIYTEVPYGQHGSAEFSVEKLLNEHPGIFRLQRLGRGHLQTAPASRKGRRNRADFLWCRRPEFHVVIPCHRRDLRQGLPARRIGIPSAPGHPDRHRPSGRRGDHRVQDFKFPATTPLSIMRSHAPNAGWSACCMLRAAQPGDLQRSGHVGHGALAVSMNAPTALRRRLDYAGPALFSYGFRPFFLGAAVWAARRDRIMAAAIFRPSEICRPRSDRSTGTSTRLWYATQYE